MRPDIILPIGSDPGENISVGSVSDPNKCSSDGMHLIPGAAAGVRSQTVSIALSGEEFLHQAHIVPRLHAETFE